MAMETYPVVMRAEFRGLEARDPFVDKNTGEVVQPPTVLKLEREVGDAGDVSPFTVMLRDDVVVDFDYSDLKRGEEIDFDGEVSIYSRRDGTGGHLLRAHRLTRVAGPKLKNVTPPATTAA